MIILPYKDNSKGDNMKITKYSRRTEKLQPLLELLSTVAFENNETYEVTLKSPKSATYLRGRIAAIIRAEKMSLIAAGHTELANTMDRFSMTISKQDPNTVHFVKKHVSDIYDSLDTPKDNFKILP